MFEECQAEEVVLALYDMREELTIGCVVSLGYRRKQAVVHGKPHVRSIHPVIEKSGTCCEDNHASYVPRQMLLRIKGG